MSNCSMALTRARAEAESVISIAQQLRISAIISGFTSYIYIYICIRMRHINGSVTFVRYHFGSYFNKKAKSQRKTAHVWTSLLKGTPMCAMFCSVVKLPTCIIQSCRPP